MADYKTKLELTWIGKGKQPKLESNFFVFRKPLDSCLRIAE